MTSAPRLTIRRPVVVMARVTPALREELKREIRGRLERLEMEMKQLDLQEKRLLGAPESREQGKSQHIEQELLRQRSARRSEMRELLVRERQVEELALGSTIRRGTVDAEAEIGPGDRLDDLMGWELVVEDGVVVEIRKGEGGSP